MHREPKIIDEQPNVENTIPLAAFRAQYPARFSLLEDDKFVLHGGGIGYLVELSDVSDSQNVTIDNRIGNMNGKSVSVYVLNQCLILWINEANVGIEIPYTQIALHALKEYNGNPVLYLQLLSSDLFTCQSTSPSEYTQTVEMVLHEAAEPHIHTSPLFTRNSTIQELYDALSTCSALHFDSESESGSAMDSDFGGQWITADTEISADTPQLDVPAGWLNAGVADDLEAVGPDGSDGEAGMNVTVVSGQVAGVRRRNSEIDDKAKVRKIGI